MLATHVRNRNQHKDRLMHLAIVELHMILLLKLLEVLRGNCLLQDGLHVHVLSPCSQLTLPDLFHHCSILQW